MNKPGTLRAALAASLLGLGAWHAGTAVAAQPIIAGSITNSPPMIAYADDGKTLKGVIVDLAAAMNKHLPAPIEFKPEAFPNLFPAMQSHQIDVAFTMMNDTAQREKLVDFVDFFNLGTKLLVRKGNPEHVTDLHSLCGKTVSTVQGSIQIELVKQADGWCAAHGKPAVTNMQYAQPSDARMQVQIGRVAAFFGNSPVMVYLAKTAGGGKLFDVAGPEYQQVPLGIAVPKDKPQLRDELRKALQATIDDGSYLKVLSKYGVQGGAVKSAAVNAGAKI
ncbi:ABC transporter substrate-binding protein [Thiomonas sp.]|jgi:polar amino acid transport system substrate-binding protein|uniref:ABC transporter substrate-binding protein n=1 Tax=Thiomonas sp. TaxID=2047785 RepID=UPI00261C3B16|nr:ABC transporter substrate-binding protein [Thiomonas sp.]